MNSSRVSRRPFFGGSARASRHSGGGNRDARHMDVVRIACAKPLLLREAVKEAVASGRVEKLQPKEPQTWKTTRRVGKSFANGWRFRRTSDRRQIRPRPSPKGPSSRTSFSAAAASRTTESWDGCCRASAGRDRSSRSIRLERFSPLARSVDFERYDFRVGGFKRTYRGNRIDGRDTGDIERALTAIARGSSPPSGVMNSRRLAASETLCVWPTRERTKWPLCLVNFET